MLSKMSEADEYGYDGSYFTSGSLPSPGFAYQDGYITSSPPTSRKPDALESETETESEAMSIQTPPEFERRPLPIRPEAPPMTPRRSASKSKRPYPVQDTHVAELVVFDYGVAVFLGFEEAQEKSILEDLNVAGLLTRPIEESDWEIEQGHYIVSISCILT